MAAKEDFRPIEDVICEFLNEDNVRFVFPSSVAMETWSDWAVKNSAKTGCKAVARVRERIIQERKNADDSHFSDIAFVGIDTDGQPRHAAVRATDGRRFMYDRQGLAGRRRSRRRGPDDPQGEAGPFRSGRGGL